MFLPGEIIKKENDKIYFKVGKGNMVLILNENEATPAQNGVEIKDEVANKSPWIQLANEIKDKEYFMARSVPEGNEVVVPVVNLEDDMFLGYRVIADKDGNILKVLDAGKYKRYSFPQLDKYELLLPIEKILDVSDIEKEEFSALADTTPIELLPKIYEYDKDLAGVLTVEKLRRDPLSLTSMPENDLKKLLEIAREYIALASQKLHPTTIKILLKELRTKAPTVAPELYFIENESQRGELN